MVPSLTALLSSIIDYAGLFPPSQLRLNEAMDRYAAYQTGPFSWMLGCFLVPLEQLDAFRSLVPYYNGKTGAPVQWPVRIIMPRALEELTQDQDTIEHLLASQVHSFKCSNRNHEVSINSLEFPPLPVNKLEHLISSIQGNIDAFFELSLHHDFEQSLAIIKDSEQKAKVRTGGLTPNTFPNAEQLGQFILACARSKVPYKATAGLHDPMTGTRPVIDQAHSFSVKMHGFLNIAVATALAYRQATTTDAVIKILNQTSVESFQFELDGLRLGNTLESEPTRQWLSLTELIQSHQQIFQSFGSCSFQTPIQKLQALHLC